VHDKLHIFERSYTFVLHKLKYIMNNNKSSQKLAILSAISDEIDLWLDKESHITDGYEYECEFITTSRKINQILFSKSLGEITSNRNKKKNFIPVLEPLK